ncbi:MAG: hypothetical protein HQL94_08885 [Magnetococcales bacterium]|nr:hypothetical protein [Magnetococcales bacterium]MBF0439779.1 hypothetical protein [Magnetococcales bacterium]
MVFQMLGSLEPKKKFYIFSVVLFVVLGYALAIYLSANILYDNRYDAQQHHAARMSPTLIESGKTKPEPLPEKGDFIPVKIGTYIDNIENFSIRDSSWSANFFLWFSWTGPKNLDPGGKFIVVDGTITKKDLLEEYHGDQDVHYQKYKVSAKFIKYFDTMRVPIEGHMLNIYIEDGSRDGTKLRYVMDPSSNVSSRTRVPGYKIVGNSAVVKNHTYKSAYGDPRLPADAKTTFTQYIFGLEIQRSNFGVFIKIFTSLYAALILALSNFFVKPSDVGPRFSLPTAAFFGAVANSYVANSILPPSGSFGLVDFIAAFGMGTIFLTIALSLLSNYWFVKKNDTALALVLDRIMFYVLSVGCVAANIIIPLSAHG